MKKWFTFPKITIAFLLLFAGGVIYSNLKADPNKLTPKKFVQDTLPQIVENWDVEYSAPLFALPKEEVTKGILLGKEQLGTCVVDKLSWGGSTQVSYTNPKQSRYAYIAHATCTKNNQSLKGKMLIVVNGEFKYIQLKW